MKRCHATSDLDCVRNNCTDCPYNWDDSDFNPEPQLKTMYDAENDCYYTVEDFNPEAN